jgi:hypothetical protein
MLTTGGLKTQTLTVMSKSVLFEFLHLSEVLNKVHLSAFGLLSLRLLVTHILEHQ